MDAQQFLAEFGHIANAPGGVARVREFVLRLAVQGRLVPQNDQDEPAEYFLMRIAGQKLPLQRQRTKKASITSVDSHKYLPSGWTLTLLNNLANPQAGFAFKANLFNQNGIGLPIIRVRDVGFSVPATYFSGEYRDEFLVKNGDWLVAMDGDFRVAMWEASTALLNQRVTRLQFYSTEINSKYVCIALQFELRKLQGIKNYTTVDHLSGSQIAESMIALPPIQEQSRIVAKVDELMALCDTLEAQQQARRKLQNNLRLSTLQAVASATSPHELQATWARLADNFGQLFHAPEDVRELRDVVFDLALRGLLLPTSQTKIQIEQVSADLQLSPVGWRWMTLEELSEYITSGSRGWKAYLANTGDAFIRSQDIKSDALIFENPAHVALPEKAEGKRTLVNAGDLLLTITGGNVGKCAIVPDLPYKAYVSQHVALIRLRDPKLSEFIHFWMINAYGGRGFLSRYIYGDKPGLNLTQVGSVPIPVPPEVERNKILINLRGHQKLFDRLMGQLKAKQLLSTALATAVASSFTGTAMEEAEQPAPNPETEAIA